jgi:predicted proteasome-type protease
MNVCLGVTVEEGLVGIADTRVVSGSESLTARKVATYQGPGYSFFIMTSGPGLCAIKFSCASKRHSANRFPPATGCSSWSTCMQRKCGVSQPRTPSL